MVLGGVRQQIRQQALEPAARVIAILRHLHLDEQRQPFRQTRAGQLVAQAAFVGLPAHEFRVPVQSPQQVIGLPLFECLP